MLLRADISCATDRPDSPAFPEVPDWDESRVRNSDEDVVLSHNWHELRQFMWDYVGIVRTSKRLERAMHRIDLLKQEVHEYYSNYRVSTDLIELRNLIHVADLIECPAATVGRCVSGFFPAVLVGKAAPLVCTG